MSDEEPVVARLREMDVATVHEASGRHGDLAGDISPIQQGVTIAGPAFTAAVQPGDNLAIHRAVVAAPEGSVLVVAAGGHVAGYWGEILAVAAQHEGIVGLVIDGGARDTAALRRRGFPVWCAGVSVHGTVKQVPGEIDVPVSVGGVVVRPGDYVLADDDGVVVVPRERATDVLDAADARSAKEERIMAALAEGSGTTIDLMGLTEAAARA